MNPRAWVGSGVVFAAATFNMGLCFLNTHMLAISVTQIIAGEAIILGVAGAVSYRVITLQASVFAALLLAYFCTIWLFTGAPNPKVLRDVLIPIVFGLCGIACAEPQEADRLVYTLIAVVFVIAMIEWLWLEWFLKIFNILDYYLAKGRIDDSQVWMEIDLALNGMRPEDEGRTLFPSLGLHRVSSIFLEPVSTGNFAVIAFAWLLVRFKAAPARNIVCMALVVAVFVLADSRFAAVTCLVLVVACMLPILPSVVLWLLPFVSIAVLMRYAAMFPLQQVDQSFRGRLVGAGRLIANFDAAEWFGVGHRLAQSTVDNLDSGYAYAIYAVGLPGLVFLWTAFSFARDQTVTAARYRTLLALYMSVGFFVTQSIFSIKTAALAWFLLGVSQNADVAVVRGVPSTSKLQVWPA
jgi:putative polymerase